jgi:hypothetical protein
MNMGANRFRSVAKASSGRKLFGCLLAGSLVVVWALTISCDPPEEPPKCGDAERDQYEVCEGNDLGGQACDTLTDTNGNRKYVGGVLACSVNCTFNESQCTPLDSCGNQQLDSGEDCDGMTMGVSDCGDVTDASGSHPYLAGQPVSCNPNCSLNVSQCISAGTCGNHQLDPGEDCDDQALRVLSCGDITDINGNHPYLPGGTLSCNPGCVYNVSGCTLAGVCVGSTYRCVGKVLEQCKPDGSAWVEQTTCADVGLCDDNAGTCMVCMPDEERSCTDGCDPGETGTQTCAASGQFWGGCNCPADVCTPNSYDCNGDTLRRCRSNGSGYDTVEQCDPGLCSDSAGKCLICNPGTVQDCTDCPYGATGKETCSSTGLTWGACECPANACNIESAYSACNDCMNQYCETQCETCGANAKCKALMLCYINCEPGNTGCVTMCESQANDADAIQLGIPLSSCISSNGCTSACHS